MNHGSAGIAQGEILAVRFEGEIGVQLLAQDGSVLPGGEDNEIGVRTEELASWEGPLPGHGRVVCQAVATEIKLGSGVEDLDPVRRFAIHVIDRVLVVGDNLVDDELSGGGEGGQDKGQEPPDTCQGAGEGCRSPGKERLVGVGDHEVNLQREVERFLF